MTTQEIDAMFTSGPFLCKSGQITLGSKNLGKVYEKDKYLYYQKFEKEKDIFRIFNAWSIPNFIFDKVDYIVFITKENIYRLITADAVKQYLHFKTSGIELKVYISLDQWSIEKRTKQFDPAEMDSIKDMEEKKQAFPED